MEAIFRGLSNLYRRKARTLTFIAMLAMVLSLLVLLGQAALAMRGQVASLEGRVRTLIELREAGAFGTGGFGLDKPVGEEGFTLATLEKVRRIPGAAHLARIDEYLYKPLIDPAQKNAYAMLIGLKPGAALRAIGEIDYESARIVAGRSLLTADETARVAVVGLLFARQRLGVEDASRLPPGLELQLAGQSFRVIGLYATGNDFGDNHVFIPLAAFRQTFRPGDKLSKIFVTVDSVAHVERVTAELKQALAEADVVTTPEAVSTARTSLAGLSLAALLGAALLFAIGATLIGFAMMLALRERVNEIGTLKALGAPRGEIVGQFLAESLALCGSGGLCALLLALPLAPLLGRALRVVLMVDARVAAGILLMALLFAALGSLYPVLRALRLSPIDALRKE